MLGSLHYALITSGVANNCVKEKKKKKKKKKEIKKEKEQGIVISDPRNIH
jgi:hypothetical protein